MSYSAKVPGQLEMTVKVGAMKGSAVFDQNVSAFISSTYDIADFAVDETITTPEAMTMHVAYDVKAMHYETASTPAGADALDGTISHGHVGSYGNHRSSPAPPAGGHADGYYRHSRDRHPGWNHQGHESPSHLSA